MVRFKKCWVCDICGTVAAYNHGILPTGWRFVNNNGGCKCSMCAAGERVVVQPAESQNNKVWFFGTYI